jgi:hypothetical protein
MIGQKGPATGRVDRPLVLRRLGGSCCPGHLGAPALRVCGDACVGKVYGRFAKNIS